MSNRWTFSQIMIATGVIATATGLLARHPRSLLVVEHLILPIAVIAGVGSAIYFVSRLRPKYRLAIEATTLIALIGLSAVIWNPYIGEERQCLELAQQATAASASYPETRIALDHEAAWFRRRATDLRWRGLWLGLTLGPRTRDVAAMGRHSLTYELGTIESMDKHKKEMMQLIAVWACPDE